MRLIGKEIFRAIMPPKNKFGYLHIGKTGGTSINSFIDSCHAAGEPGLKKFGHSASLKKILSKEPRMKLAFVVRDPIKRFVSAFDSRLRNGRPNHQALWHVNEAVAFSYFSTPNALAEALSSEDPRMLSAARFAFKQISHLRRNYAYHLHGVNFLKKHRDRIYFACDIGDLDSRILDMFSPAGVDERFILEKFERRHVAPINRAKVVRQLSALALENLKIELRSEYEIYNFVLAEFPHPSQQVTEKLGQ